MKKLALTAALIFYFFVSSAQLYYLDEDFNSGGLPAGWSNTAITGSNLWKFGIDGAFFYPGDQNLNGTRFAYFDDDSLGNFSTNDQPALLTPVINLPFISNRNVYLEFDYNFRYQGYGETFNIEAYNGTNWVILQTINSDDCGSYINTSCVGNFPHARINLNAHLNSQFQIRFRYDDNRDWGWYAGIDNVQIISISDKDIASIAIENDKSCVFTGSDSITGIFQNRGHAAIDSFRLGYQIDNLPIIWDSVYRSIPAGNVFRHTFSQTANLDSIRVYPAKLFAQLFQDPFTFNDTITTQVEHQRTYPISFFDDFEDSSIVWEIGGLKSSWERATPNTSQLSSAYSGSQSMVTNANGRYNVGEDSYLVSPCLTKDTGTLAVVNFYTNFRFQGAFFHVDYSAYQDGNWSRVLDGRLSDNWYNRSLNFFGGRSLNNNWQLSRNILEGIENDTLFQLRFKFFDTSTWPIGSEGVSIDNFLVYNANTSNIAIEDFLDLNRICKWEDSTNFEIRLSNYGGDTIFNFNASFRLNNGQVFSENASDTILPFSTYDYTFSQKADLSADQLYNIDFWVQMASDTIKSDDSLLNQQYDSRLYEIRELTAPFIEDFDQVPLLEIPDKWNKSPKLSSYTIWGANKLTSTNNGTGPNQDHTSGLGNYMQMFPTGFTGSNSFESPCLSVNQLKKPIYTYWLHLYGGFTNYFLEIFYDKKWTTLELFNSQIQNSSTDPFVRRAVDLSPYKDQRIKIRHRLASSHQSFTPDVALDDIAVFEASLISQIEPNYNCNASSKVGITAQLTNLLRDTLYGDSIQLSYQLNNQPATLDTLTSSLAFGDDLPFVFSDSLDISAISGRLNLSVKVRDLISGIILDSMDIEIPNPSSSNYISQDFENIEVRNGLSIPNWSFSGGWKLIDDTQTGPNQVPPLNSTLGGSNYASSFLEANNIIQSRRNASILLPCFTIAAGDSLSLKYKYHMIGDSLSTMLVSANAMGTTTVLDTIIGNSQGNNWENQIIDLSSYSGQRVQLVIFFRNRTQNITSGFAVDDIQIVDQRQTMDARLISSELQLTDCDAQSARMAFEIENNGGLDLAPNQINAHYQIIGQPVVSQPINISMPAGRVTRYFLNVNPLLGLSNQNYIVDSWISTANDANTLNDSILNQSITTLNARDSIVEDFDALVDLSCNAALPTTFDNGWTSDFGLWAVQNGFACNGTPTPMTGPIRDNTTGLGNFMYIQAETNTNQLATLTSPCLDMSRLLNPKVTYWYHMYGNDINTLYIESNASGSWQVIDSIVGQQQTSSISPWLEDTVQLGTQFVSQNFQLRFSSMVSGAESNIAIDDIKISGDSIVTNNSEITNARNLNSLSVYPNPNNGQFFIQGSEKLVGKEYQITNLQGQVVKQGRINNSLTELRINKESKGIYLLIIPELGEQRKVVVY